MPRPGRKLRRSVFSLIAYALQALKSFYDRMTRRTVEAAPDYTQLENNLYLGGRCSLPPPGTRAVLNLSPYPDSFAVEFHESRPFPSASPPTMAWLQRQVEFIDLHLQAGRTVFVHCDAGLDRSATVLVAYLMWRDRKSSAATIETIQKKRTIRPNPAFMQVLGDWEAHLQKDIQK